MRAIAGMRGGQLMSTIFNIHPNDGLDIALLLVTSRPLGD